MHKAVTVAAAMIVRDEQHFLPGCLASLQGLVDEIVIVDTGSTDLTVEIATKANARLYHHVWTQDFAAARNVALDAVVSDWVLYIDADERLRLPKGGVLADYIDPGAIAGFVRLQPRTGHTRYREWRLFRSDPRIRFTGRIHETMVPAIRAIVAGEGLAVTHTTVEIDHLGYDGDQSHKYARNLALLQTAVKAEPDKAYYWYHLAETLSAVGRQAESEIAANEGLASARRVVSDEQRGAASLIHQFLARAMTARGDDALEMVTQGLLNLPEDHALRLLHGHALLAAGRPHEALGIAEALRAVDPEGLSDGLMAFDRGIFENKACELAALAHLQLGNRHEAASCFAEAWRLAPGEHSYRIRAIALGGPNAITL